MRMTEMDYNLLTSKYTTVYFDEDSIEFNAPNHFMVTTTETNEQGERELLTDVTFQSGPIKENGVNGVANEDLISMVIMRLQSFQNSEYNCRENALAITKLEEALLWLRARTMGRDKRGVEGTSEV